MTHLMGKYHVSTTLGVVWEQTWRSLLMYHYGPDSSTQFSYPHPMFGSWISPLIVLGLGYAVRWWRVPGSLWTIFSQPGHRWHPDGRCTGLDAPGGHDVRRCVLRRTDPAPGGGHCSVLRGAIAARGSARTGGRQPGPLYPVHRRTRRAVLIGIALGYLAFLAVGGRRDWVEYTRFA
ncbi:MAG: hypothetical protein HZY76_05815 [Anaerolineae bacterium]|nr:MAG: hypothetical protein HZY76_05815 [Anaerolineae bacterium]